MSDEVVETKTEQEKDKPKGMAITGMVCGICGIVLSITPCTVMLGLPAGIVGIIFSAIASNSIKAGKADGKAMAKTGLICGIVGVALGIIVMAGCSEAADEFSEALDEFDEAIEELDSSFNSSFYE